MQALVVDTGAPQLIRTGGFWKGGELKEWRARKSWGVSGGGRDIAELLEGKIWSERVDIIGVGWGTLVPVCWPGMAAWGCFRVNLELFDRPLALASRMPILREKGGCGTSIASFLRRQILTTRSKPVINSL